MTGFMFGTMGVGQVFHILVGTFIINPNNESASMTETVGDVTYHYFRSDIASNVKTYLLFTILLQFILHSIGVKLIDKAHKRYHLLFN
jgi:hypothetical protein